MLFWNARARNTHVAATLNLSFAAQVRHVGCQTATVVERVVTVYAPAPAPVVQSPPEEPRSEAPSEDESLITAGSAKTLGFSATLEEMQCLPAWQIRCRSAG